MLFKLKNGGFVKNCERRHSQLEGGPAHEVEAVVLVVLVCVCACVRACVRVVVVVMKHCL